MYLCDFWTTSLNQAYITHMHFFFWILKSSKYTTSIRQTYKKQNYYELKNIQNISETQKEAGEMSSLSVSLKKFQLKKYKSCYLFVVSNNVKFVQPKIIRLYLNT